MLLAMLLLWRKSGSRTNPVNDLREKRRKGLGDGIGFGGSRKEGEEILEVREVKNLHEMIEDSKGKVYFGSEVSSLNENKIEEEVNETQAEMFTSVVLALSGHLGIIASSIQEESMS